MILLCAYIFVSIAFYTLKCKAHTYLACQSTLPLFVSTRLIACVQTSPISFVARGKGTSAQRRR